ncbi:hypothetical protein R50072_38090 [Simiduia litorea]|uniref:hypothetical protein n=1 Tax=Simiduia litorea TaxID=1435348 RepID=UPI0036F38D3E
MHKYIFIVFLMCSCSTLNNNVIKPEDRDLIKSAAVVSKIADNLHCSYIGLTVFNNTNNLIPLDNSLDAQFSKNLANELSALGVQSYAIDKDSVSYVNPDVGPEKWDNVRAHLPPTTTTLVILDGTYTFNSRGGYYARNNGLTTSASIYIYDLASGRLLGKGSANRYFPDGNFTCDKSYVHPLDHLTRLVERSAAEIGKEVINEITK